MPQSNSPYFEFLHRALGEGIVGVEIGIWNGGNAEAVMGHIKPKTYYMIDPYKESSEYRGPQYTQSEFDKTYEKMYSFFSKIPGIVILKMTSSEASVIVPDGLDFVYIDGAHDYENKTLDLNTWYPKVRIGGVVGGDDYVIPSVIKAVKDFEEKHGLKFEIADYVAPHPPEYWLIKEKEINVR
jgi:hypothetical protein